MEFSFATLARPLRSLSWTLLPICAIALVIGFVGELAILGPNITLERGSAGGWAIGSTTALQACGIVASGPLSAYLLGRIGSAQVFAIGGAVCFIALTALAASETTIAIAIFRFGFAIGLGLIVIVSQYVVIARAPAQAKATTLGIFASFASIGSALVPPFIHWSGSDMAPVYAGGVLGLLIAILCAACIFRHGRAEVISSRHAGGIVSRIGVASFSSGIVYGVLTNGFSALLAVYAMRVGYSVAEAGTIVMAGLIGTFLLEIPVGWLCDQYTPSRVIGAFAGIVVSLMLLILLVNPCWALLLTLAFVLGGLCNAFYIVGLIEMSRMRPTDLAAGTASFILACGLGEIAGPIAGGVALETFGPQGFIAIFLAVLIAYFGARTASNPIFIKSARANCFGRASWQEAASP